MIHSLWLLIPIAFIVWLIWAIVAYRRTPREDTEKRNSRRLLIIIPAFMLGMMVLVIGGLCILFAIAIRHM